MLFDFDAELTATVDERFRGAGGDVAGSLRWLAERLGADPTPAPLQRAAEVRLAAERSFGEPRPDAVAVLRSLHDQADGEVVTSLAEVVRLV